MKRHFLFIGAIVLLFIIAISCQKAVEIGLIGQNSEEEKNPVVETPKAIKQLEFSKMMPLADERIYSVAVADFNKDGYDDIVAGVYTEYSEIFMNNKDGTFEKNPVILKKYNTQVIAIIDFNNDGNKDLILGNNQQPIVLLKNNGDNSFSLYKELDRTIVNDIAVADFDNNGFEDFIIATQFKENYVYFNSNGEFEKVKISDFLDNMPAKSVSAADFNNDNYVDFVMGMDMRTSKVYINDKNKKFTMAAELPGLAHTYDIAIFDSDKDGNLDILQGNNKEQSMIFLNKNGFTGSPAFGSGNTYTVLAADFDNDGEKEVVIGDYEINTKIYRKINNEYSLLKEIETPERDFVRSLAAGDFNGDGYLDLVIGREKSMSAVYVS